MFHVEHSRDGSSRVAAFWLLELLRGLVPRGTVAPHKHLEREHFSNASPPLPRVALPLFLCRVEVRLVLGDPEGVNVSRGTLEPAIRVRPLLWCPYHSEVASFAVEESPQDLRSV